MTESPENRSDVEAMRVALDDMAMVLGPGGWESCVADLIRTAPGVLARLAAVERERDELRARLATISLWANTMHGGTKAPADVWPGLTALLAPVRPTAETVNGDQADSSIVVTDRAPRCVHRWASGQDRNPHECTQHGGHLGLHRCGCGAVSA